MVHIPNEEQRIRKKLARVALLEKKDRLGECHECRRPKRPGRNLCEFHGSRRTHHQGRYVCSVCGQSGHNRQRCPQRT